MVALILWIGLSLVLYRIPTTPTVHVAALHYNAGILWSAVDKFNELTRRAAQDGACIIVWLEIAIEGDPQVTCTTEFRQLAAESDAYLVLGYVVREGEHVWRDEATVLSPGGQFLSERGEI
ncbi:hypothetical protein [uncultured Thermanaerothrix sp.]|uniref:hypothetical protein n=1 Tax=uncultured Thermanaerothrix sp. TaxID=1195149 RepID=UPI00261EBD66|nr:hypothetical protein [uncultured Thermanaerothrix sp.]